MCHIRTICWLNLQLVQTDGTRVESITAIGRATITRLRMNNPVIIFARKRWVISGWHPLND
ncbi:hypothetical protein FJR11_21690 [Anabaena sp. UHCC 0187]|nr:hypothetical protein [Anabaena sp. UHCC 0187]